MKKVYLESTIISYLVALPSRDLIKAAHQQLTREWWERRRDRYENFVSGLVMEEISAGDEVAAARRLQLASDLKLIAVTERPLDMAASLLSRGLLPKKAMRDATHLAIAVIHEMDFLLTWNCRHLANAELFAGLRKFMMEKGYSCPVICTPNELLENEDVL